jgi:hypothetical protein
MQSFTGNSEDNQMEVLEGISKIIHDCESSEMYMKQQELVSST